MEKRVPTQEEHELIAKYWEKKLYDNTRSSARPVLFGFCILVLIPIIMGMIVTKFDSSLVMFFIIILFLMFRISKMSEVNKYNLELYNDFFNKKYKIISADAIDFFVTGTSGKNSRRGLVKVNVDGITMKDLYCFPLELAYQYKKRKEPPFPILLIQFDENHPRASFFRKIAIPLIDEGGKNEKEC